MQQKNRNLVQGPGWWVLKVVIVARSALPAFARMTCASQSCRSASKSGNLHGSGFRLLASYPTASSICIMKKWIMCMCIYIYILYMCVDVLGASANTSGV